MNPFLPDDPGSKVNACVRQHCPHLAGRSGGQADTAGVLRPVHPGSGKAASEKEAADADDASGGRNGHAESSFNVYDDIRAKLIAQGVPPEQIAFIHEANTEVQKKELFAKVRSGQVRVLMGSTAEDGRGNQRSRSSRRVARP